MDNKCEDMWEYLAVQGRGCKVKTPDGIGIFIGVDAGAAILVEPLAENDEWRGKYDIRELESVRE